MLADLLRERAAIEPIRAAVPHLWALLDDEIARLGAAAAADAKTAAALSSLAAGLPRPPFAPPPLPAPRKRVKLPVPADKYPEYNFVGRLLGPRGTTLKTLERDTGCKIMIRGKGSIRKDKEPDVRGKPGWEHVFNEALHVVIEVGDAVDDAAAALALARAKDAVEVLLVPVPEERDSLKRQQLRALAIMNGTYRGAANPARGAHDSLCSLPAYAPASSPPPPQSPALSLPAFALDHPAVQQPAASPGPAAAPGPHVFLGDSVGAAAAAASSQHIVPQPFDHPQEDQPALFRHMSYPRFEHAPPPATAYDRKLQQHHYQNHHPHPTLRQHSGRRTPSSGATSPRPGQTQAPPPPLFSDAQPTANPSAAAAAASAAAAAATSSSTAMPASTSVDAAAASSAVAAAVSPAAPAGDMSALTSKMQQCAVDEFASSSVGDDSPDSSHTSEDGEPSTHIMAADYSGAGVKVSAMSPGSRAETAVGVGGFLGQEFYNGAFSNGLSPNPWDQTAPSPPFSSGLYGYSSPIPSPQVLTTSSTTVTPIDRRNGY